VQDTQVIEGVPIVYSLGNALSNQNDLPARLEACATLRIVCRWGEPPTVLAPQLEFLWCTKPGMVEDSYSAVPVTLPKENWRDQNDYQRMQNTLEQF
jgi:poly-gamma-glutamate synthesis protein (capsule biosynthesis protein)